VCVRACVVFARACVRTCVNVNARDNTIVIWRTKSISILFVVTMCNVFDALAKDHPSVAA
jgi:hypothetical protein